MKKILSVIAVLVLSVCFMFSGCSPKLELPQGDVGSNGGSVLVVGDYVYYANTFVDYSSLSGDDNTEGTTKHNAIYRVKTDAYGYTTKDNDGQIENIEKVYAKIAGFNNSNMFVVGSYLYFTSPNIHKEQKTGNDKFDLTTLLRIKLDGTGLQEILTTQTSQGKFYLVTEQNPYLLLFDNNQISKLNISDNLSNPQVLAEDVLDAVFPKNYGTLDKVYYTKDISEDDKNSGLSGNYLYRLTLSSGSSVQLGKPANQTITLVAYENNVLYYKLLLDGSAFYYSSPLDAGFGSNQTQWSVVGQEGETDSVSNFTVINENNVVYKAESQVYLATKGAGSLANISVLVASDANVEMASGDYVYYSTTEGLYKISYKDQVEQTVALQKNIKTGSCDIADEYVYFYAKLDTNTTENYYAFRANIKTPELGRQKCECIATVLAEDLSAE